MKTDRATAASSEETVDLLVGFARAFGGAIFFSLPLLMTMEMWWLGFYMDRLRLALFMVVMLPILIGLDHYSGFRETESWSEDVLDGIIAYGVGVIAAAVILTLLNITNLETPLREWVGKVALLATPAAFGAVLATSQLGGGNGDAEAEEERQQVAGYGAELFLMMAGAIFFTFNVAPTEEMILLSYRMTPWHAVVLILVSLAMMHAFVYAVEFHGSHSRDEAHTGWGLFLRFTVVGYAITTLASAYVLWTFGRYDPAAHAIFAMQVVVLSFPGALGAAAARLII